jgi:hypothetical protein
LLKALSEKHPTCCGHFREAITMREDPEHPILKGAWEYEIIEFSYRKPEEAEPYLEMVLRKGTVTRRLRFYSPQDLRIEGAGFPSTMGLEILDVRARQMAGLGVRVANYENSGGVPQFWSRAVDEIFEKIS